MTPTASDQEINAVVQRVLAELRASPRGAPTPLEAPRTATGDGLFADVDSAVTAARAAYEQLDRMTLARRKDIISAVRGTMREHAQSLAQMAHSETGLGRWQDKVQK